MPATWCEPGNRARPGDPRQRFLSFLVGLFLGAIVAQRAYVSLAGSRHLLMLVRHPALALGFRRSPSHQASGADVPPGVRLRNMLLRVAPDREVLVAISSVDLARDGGMLDAWLRGVRQAGVGNYIVVAIDGEAEGILRRRGVNVVLREVDLRGSAQVGTGQNHAVSAQKYGILEEFLRLGWSVLLSDVDVAVLKDPFDYLRRDSDVEAMSDGFDEGTAYGRINGFDDPSMGWSRYAQYVSHFNLNSGLFYVKANRRTVGLMERLAGRLGREKYWDQTAFNEEIFFLSHGDYASPQVTVRVMDIHEFMNSKTLFKFVRNLPAHQRPEMPVMVHINYHPDKQARMEAVMAYHSGDDHALDRFPGGSEPGT